MADAHRRKFDVVVVWSFDRMARSVSHLLRVLETFNSLGIAFVSLREQIDTSTPAGKMIFTVLGAVAELERSLIAQRVKAGLRNARGAFWTSTRLRRYAPRGLDCGRLPKSWELGSGLCIASSLGVPKFSKRFLERINRAAQMSPVVSVWPPPACSVEPPEALEGRSVMLGSTTLVSAPVSSTKS